jgi:hypothetical protein
MSSILYPCKTFASNPNNRKRRVNGDLPQAESAPSTWSRQVCVKDRRREPGEKGRPWGNRNGVTFTQKVDEGWSPVGLAHTCLSPNTILGTVITQSAGRPTIVWRKKTTVMFGGETFTKAGTQGARTGRGLLAHDLPREQCRAARRNARFRDGTAETDGWKDRPGPTPPSPEERGRTTTAKRIGWTDGGKTPKKGRSPPTSLTTCWAATTGPHTIGQNGAVAQVENVEWLLHDAASSTSPRVTP